MLRSLTARVQWLRHLASRRDVEDLDRLAASIELNARRLRGMPVPSAGGAGGPDLAFDQFLNGLRATDEVLGALVREQGEGGAAAATPTADPQHADEAEHARVLDTAPPRATLPLIGLRDEALLAAESQHTTARQVAERFSRRIGEILEADGVLVTETSVTLDPTRQHVVDTRTTSDPALHGTVAEVLGPGYSFHGRILRPEQVVTWRRVTASTSRT